LAKVNVKKVLTAIFEEIEGVNRIRVQGWTMGFNDGDPCYHQQAASVGCDDEYEIIEEEERDDVSEELSEKAAALLSHLEDDFEILHDTNWTLDIVRDESAEGGYRISESFYDCGY